MRCYDHSSLCCVSWSRCCVGGCHTHVQSRAASRDSSRSEEISRSGLCFCEPSGLCGNFWICQVFCPLNASVVSSTGFSGAAGFHRAQVGSPRMIHTDGIDPRPCRRDCRVFFCTVGGKDTCGHTRPSCKATCERLACDTDPQSLLPVATLLWCAKLWFKRRSRVLSDSRVTCACSCGALRRLFLGGASVGSKSSSSSYEAQPPCSISDSVGFVTAGPLYPRTVCCHDSSAAWAALCCLVQIQPS